MECVFEHFTDCTIIKTIGSGSYGTVFEAIENKTGKRIALKMCPLKNEQSLTDLKKEIHILSLINSSFFPKFYYYKHCGSFVVIAQELCLGVTLNELLTVEEKSIIYNENKIIFILHQILDAVNYLHSHNIIHRDLKLENIIISETNKIKICDFGFACFFDQEELIHDFCGSNLYCSPEILSNTPYNGPANDIWTIGICILKLCVGNTLFHDISNGKCINTLYTVFEKNIVSRRLKMLLKTIIREDPSQRPSLTKMYSSLGLKMPDTKVPKIIYIDIVTSAQMHSLGYNITNMLCDNKISTKRQEPKVYKLLFEKNYNTEEDNKFKLTEKQKIEIYKSNVKVRRRMFCCNEIHVLEFLFFDQISIDTLLDPSRIAYSFTRKNNTVYNVLFSDFYLVLDLELSKCKKNSYLVKFTNYYGCINVFSTVIQLIMTSFNKNYIYEANKINTYK